VGDVSVEACFGDVLLKACVDGIIPGKADGATDLCCIDEGTIGAATAVLLLVVVALVVGAATAVLLLDAGMDEVMTFALLTLTDT
jgi:hypothetical protein